MHRPCPAPIRPRARSLGPGLEDLLDPPAEQGGDAECQRQAWIITAPFQRVDRLARDLQPPAQLGLQPMADNMNGVRITDPYDPACGDGSQLNPVSGGPTFWEALRMNGSSGNVHRMVAVSPSGPAILEVKPLNPSDITSIFLTFGRPCDPIPPFDPGFGFGCMAFLPSGASAGTFFGDPGPIPWPALVPGLVWTLQGVVIDGVSGTPEKTNVLSLVVKCS